MQQKTFRHIHFFIKVQLIQVNSNASTKHDFGMIQFHFETTFHDLSLRFLPLARRPSGETRLRGRWN